MSKFGLKCFVASFIFSLAGVFALLRTHSFWVENSVSEENQLNIEAKNIELFTANEESDPIYEKYAQLSVNNSQKDDNDSQTSEDENVSSEVQTAQSDGILYMPDNDIDNLTESSLPQTEANDLAQMEDELHEDERNIAFGADKSSQSKELQIADASLAEEFKIPLIHNYSTSKSNVSVSVTAQGNQIAMASDAVNVDNLGADDKEAVAQQEQEEQTQEKYDNPWVVAEVANKNITKNKSETAFASQVTENVEENKPAEQHVAYKMQKNILIPIPEDIMNDKNLTPQISSSAENKRLEEELRRQREQRNGSLSGDEDDSSADAKAAVEDLEQEEQAEREDGSSLSDSIAAWFSGAKNKAGKSGKGFFSSGSDEQENQSKINGKDKSSSGGGQSSIFKKLLGLSSISDNGDITPTELKLSFQPDRAEISGQTLEWLHAFSDNVVNNDDVKIEIRLDRSAPFELQQKRLKLLYRILANNGVGENKVDMIFTDREPNSFIIRNVRYEYKENDGKVKLGDNPW